MDIEVKVGEVAISKNPDSLVATGVGSCLVITLYDHKLKIGAMAHAMLSRSASCVMSHANSDDVACRMSHVAQRDTKYVTDAIDAMLTKMQEAGSKNSDLEAKLVGAANMFAAIEPDLSENSVKEAKKKLKLEHIKIIGESVGGHIGRSVEFSPKSGIVTVSIKF